MIKSLSPYYVTVPFVSPLTGITCAKFTLKIYVWDGLKIAVPVVASYSLTKTNPTGSSASDKINIARLINDFIDFEPIQGSSTGLYNAQNQRWCKTTITYDNSLIEEIPTTALILKGYGYGMSGENPQPPANRILLQGLEFKVNRNGFFNLPIILDMTILERLEIVELKVPKNTGYFDLGNILDATVNYPVSGDIVSATKFASTTYGVEVQCTMSNAMADMNYKVIISPESLTNLENDNELKVPIFRIASTTEFYVYLEETAEVVQNLRIHLDVLAL